MSHVCGWGGVGLVGLGSDGSPFTKDLTLLEGTSPGPTDSLSVASLPTYPQEGKRMMVFTSRSNNELFPLVSGTLGVSSAGVTGDGLRRTVSRTSEVRKVVWASRGDHLPKSCTIFKNLI